MPRWTLNGLILLDNGNYVFDGCEFGPDTKTGRFVRNLPRLLNQVDQIVLKASGRSGGSVYMIKRDDFLELKKAAQEMYER